MGFRCLAFDWPAGDDRDLFLRLPLFSEASSRQTLSLD
ncbi:hypothetical protein RISK_001093 [Rhodopirellula islandica]|uniref:Uncharacterized protein n=1 Tax=Rhodopirellula islandica TaxID=595434 RepID=A0A0J1EMN2_RHOIS|nr:hypothetical protein RISK_001093 [Rhodopirellula islandica]